MKQLQASIRSSAAGVIALLLLGYSAYFLFSKIQLNQQVSTDLQGVTRQLEALTRRDPSPNTENIRRVKLELTRLHGFVKNVEKHFLPAPHPAQLNNMEFRSYLDDTVARLRADALRSGVELSPDFWFTFLAQKGALTFSAESLEPLAMQLSEIDLLCRAVFNAKVNSLAWLKRMPVDKNDSFGSQDYLTRKATTNDWGVLMPYEVAFHGFSADLAAFLEELARLPQCFAVLNLVVEPMEQPMPSENLLRAYRVLPPAHDGPSVPRDRFPHRVPAPARPPHFGVPIEPATVLSERPLRFIVSVQAVRIDPSRRLTTASNIQ